MHIILFALGIIASSIISYPLFDWLNKQIHGQDTMANYNHIIEDWWRHNGCYDREQASGIPYKGQDDYLNTTDDWWNSCTNEEKAEIYEEFFEE